MLLWVQARIFKAISRAFHTEVLGVTDSLTMADDQYLCQCCGPWRFLDLTALLGQLESDQNWIQDLPDGLSDIIIH